MFVRRNLSVYPAHLAYGVVSLLTGAPLVALMLSLRRLARAAGPGGRPMVLVILSALLGLTLGHLFYYRAIRILGPIASEGSLLLIPFQTAVLAHFWLGDRLSPVQWAAGVVLVLGCTLLLRARIRMRS